jgi:hypothetical protein
MKITVKVWLQGDEDGPGRSVLIVAPDMYAYEKTFDTAITEAFTRDNPRLSDQYWLAWHSMHRSGRFDGDFEAFMSQLLAVDDLEVGSFGPPKPADAPAAVVATGAQPDPTQPAGQPAESPMSPGDPVTASVT